MRAALLLVMLPFALPAAELDEATGLRVADGWLHVRAHCGGCHSYAMVTNQRADRDTWRAMIRWMQATQNLWQFEPAVENAILDYLAANYAPGAAYRRAPLADELMPR